MLSINPMNMIYDKVVDAWSFICNDCEPAQSDCRRFFFDIGHSLYLKKIEDKIGDYEKNAESLRNCFHNWMQLYKKDLNNVDLIFVHINLHEHYFAAVINFRDKKVQYLNNKVHLDPSSYIRPAQIVQKEMAIYLKEKKNHKKIDAVVSYEIENVPFSWQTRRPDLDCGVYLMHHMKFFKGDVYSDTDLGNASVRRLLRAQICASIVLSDLNELRSEMLRTVLEFCKKKPSLVVKYGDKKKKKKQKK